MNPPSLLNWMLLSTMVLGAWWACYRLALRQERSFAYNRGFLVLGPVLAASLPLLPLAWPGSWGVVPTALPGVGAVLLPAVQVAGAKAARGAGMNWMLWVWALYLVGVCCAVTRLSAELGKLWRTTRALPREKHAGYTLARTHGQLPTSSFGRVVFWDETLPLNAAEAGQVLRHELAHVRQGHTYDRLLLELLRAALWFNPFVHCCCRALALTHEFLADEAAVVAGAASANSAAHSYATLLARQVATRLGFAFPLAHTFSHSQTLRRIAMLHQTAPIRRWKQWLALPLLALCFHTVASCQQKGEPVAPAHQPSAAAGGANALPPPAPPVPDAEATASPAGTFETNTEQAYDVAEVMPEYPGGTGKLLQDVKNSLQHPPRIAIAATGGRWIVQFTVGSDGVVRGVKVRKAAKGKAATANNDEGSEEAVWVAMQVLKTKWTPGRQNGQPVAVNVVLPIVFQPEKN